MDFVLHCNRPKCRAPLTEQSVVTGCCHMFCMQCVEKSGLASVDSALRTCPACHTRLQNQEDAVLITTNPTEEWKNTILSGLSPAIIMECASRALSFWSYQTSQEIAYAEMGMKNVSGKYAALSTRYDQLLAGANGEITELQDKLSGVSLEQKELSAKYQQLVQSYKKKSKDNSTLSKMLAEARQKHATEMMVDAAEEDASSMARRVIGEFRPGADAHHGLGQIHGKARSDESDGYRGARMTFGVSNKPDTNQSRGSTHLSNSISQPNLFGSHFPPTHNRVGTPAMRQPLGVLSSNVFGQARGNHAGIGGSVSQHAKPHRELQRDPLGAFNRNRDGSVFSRR